MTTRMQLSTDRMTYNGAKSMFVTECSDCGFPADGTIPLILDVRSHRTGNVLPFYMEHSIRTADNEITVWVYRNEKSGLTLHLLND
jgi:hypothetical protein